MTKKSHNGSSAHGSETEPVDLGYENLVSLGLDLKELLAEALQTEGLDGLRAITSALHNMANPTGSYNNVEAIGVLEELKSSSCAMQAQVTHSFNESLIQGRASRGQKTLDPEFGVGPEIAFARHRGPKTGIQYLNFCRILTEDLPYTFQALRLGMIIEDEAGIVVKETKDLTREQRMEIDFRLFTEACNIFGRGGKKLAALIRTWALAYGSQKEVDLEEKASKERYVSLFPIDRHRVKITGIMPTEMGVAIAQVLEGMVSQAKTAGDKRSRQHLAIDSLFEMLTGLKDSGSIPIQLGLIMTDRTLFQGHAEPAQLEGYGVISAEKARMLMRGGNEHPSELDVWLRRLYTAPGTGDLIAMDSKQRLFTGNLKYFIKVRDQFCRSPFCDSPIRHLDHVVQAARGGPTSVENADGTCVFCNMSKEAPGWKEETIPGPRHTKRITTFSGHVYESMAPPLPGTSIYNVEPVIPGHPKRAA